MATKFNASKKLAARLNGLANKVSGHVDVGFLEGATYPDGTTVAQAMWWFNFGHGGQFPSPPRPFFSNMVAKDKSKWPKEVAALLKATNYSGPQTLALMGENIEGSLKSALIHQNSPPLAHTTLVLRSRFGNNPHKITRADVLSAQKAPQSEEATGTQAKPGVWTGHALASTGYAVKK